MTEIVKKSSLLVSDNRLLIANSFRSSPELGTQPVSAHKQLAISTRFKEKSERHVRKY